VGVVALTLTALIAAPLKNLPSFVPSRPRAAPSLVTYLLFFAFGYFCSTVLGHFTPRQMGDVLADLFMLFYTLAGLWVGSAFVAIGLSITVLTLIGYFFVIGAAFPLWMALVNGGGLILGGLWMRRN
jgi:hypothetical protein